MSDERLDPLTEERIYLFKVLRDDETLAALRSRIRELTLTRRQANHILRIRAGRAHWFQTGCVCDECEDTATALRSIAGEPK